VLLLLWCYLRHPQMNVADKVATTLAERGRATISLFVNRANRQIGCIVTPTFSEDVGKAMLAVRLPPNQSLVIDPDREEVGHA
jgi:hypothetical protein